MPTAQFDDKGFALYYEDGGPPDGVTDYTTLVLVHGLTINGGESTVTIIFRELSLLTFE